ncbi:uncharacterized protein LOC143300077 [Babylonia areolata]|uniref:uncharacterized protein LOC143300077 n=1 Tax=Babylonia areolata TaxID=304850 RepID=UPI003FD2F335
MPLFLGCVSSKQDKSPDKKSKTKKNRRDGKQGDTIQNGGSSTDDLAPKEREAAPSSGQTDLPPEVSASQVDVTENVIKDSENVTALSSTEAPIRSTKSERHQSFGTRPVTIVREDCLISEIETALSSLSNTVTPEEASEPDAENKAQKASPQDPHPPTQDAQAAPSTTTATPTPTTTTTASAAGPPPDSEEHPSPPRPPPRPKTTTLAPSSEESGEQPSDGLPPAIPPRTVPVGKPSVTATACEEGEREKTEEEEESPPLLPPRSVPPSVLAPPKPRRSSVDSSVMEEGGVGAGARRGSRARRCSTNSSTGAGADEGGVIVRRTKPASFREPPPLPEDWAVIELPKTDAELIRLTRQPEQLATIASQYVVKHINLHTDVRVTSDLSSQIYKAFLEVSRQHRPILQRFLTDLIEDQANSVGDGQGSEPSHGAIIILAKDILCQFVGRESVVKVSLAVLQAVSRVPGATQSLVGCEATVAVLGTMSAHKASATLQVSCLELLAKIACFSPPVGHTPPLEQSATDLISLSLETFPKSVSVAQAACHALSTLVATLYKAVSSVVDNDRGASEEQQKWMTELLTLMEYVFSKGLPVVRSALRYHDKDPAVMGDGRQFLTIYSQLEQLRQRKKQRLAGLSPTLSPPPLPQRPQAQADTDLKEKVPVSERAVRGDYSPFNHKLDYENWDLLRGVLKKKSTLKGHNYSKADLVFMKQLTKTQVVAMVCALAVNNQVEDALSLLDQPVMDIVFTSEVPPGVRDFVAHQCSANDTLIDLDPGLFVRLIDAVRYPSVSFQMAQQCVLEVAGSLGEEQQVAVVAVTVEFLASTITHKALAPAMTVPRFVEDVCRELERAKEVSKNGAALQSLLSETRQCARKTVHNA